jgi:carbon storage regulator
MLMLSRKPGERIFIGDNIIVSIERLHGMQVRVGIEAPKELTVHREEVWRDIKKREKEQTNGRTVE